MDATTVAIDLAKDVFQVALANRAGRVVERQRLTRRQFERFVDTLVEDTDVIMESCATSHYWGRRMQARGLRVQLLPVQYVRPYVRRNKTDRADTDALLEAARCGEIRPVPVKTVEQQTLLAIHRVRTQWQTARVARINAMRGLLAEQGHAIPVGARTVLRRVTAILSDPAAAVPEVLRQTIALVVDEGGRERSEGRRIGLHRGLCSGQGRVGVGPDPEPAAGRARTSDPAAAGRLPASRSDEVPSVVRCGCDAAAFMADSQVPWGLDALNGAVTEPAWKTKPSWYLVSTDDRMIPPDAQRAMSKRAGSTVVESKGSHAVYVSQPRAVADLIAKAAKGVALATR